MKISRSNEPAVRISKLEVILRIGLFFLSFAVFFFAIVAAIMGPRQPQQNASVIALSIAASGIYLLVRSLTLNPFRPWLLVSEAGVIGGIVQLLEIFSELMSATSELPDSDTRNRFALGLWLAFLVFVPLFSLVSGVRDIAVRFGTKRSNWNTK